MSYKYKFDKIYLDEYICDLYVLCFYVYFFNYFRVNCKIKFVVEV